MKKKIQTRLFIIIIIGLLFSLVLNYFVQVKVLKSELEDEADSLFWQVEQILTERKAELKDSEDEFYRECLTKAKFAAYLVEREPDVVTNREKLNNVVNLLSVDEIHFFDTSGEIFAGSEPKYYGYNFDSGEQMHFFKPMLKDKSLELCQPVTPNTAEGKMMQYAAVWRSDGKGIVQIGMAPVRIMKATQKNELPYIFSQFTEIDGAVLFAANPKDYEVLGATKDKYRNSLLTDYVLDKKVLEKRDRMFTFRRSGTGERCFGVLRDINGLLVGRFWRADNVYSHAMESTLLLCIYLLVLCAALIYSISKYLEQNIIRGINDVNHKLQIITDGGLDEKVDTDITPEFSELSGHINQMVQRILAETDTMSSILELAQVPIGVYEYSHGMNRVRITSKIPQLLGLTDEEMKELEQDYLRFEETLLGLKLHPAENEEDVYVIDDKYIKIESFISENSVFGVLTDVTDAVTSKQQILQERDEDMLTGLHSLRGFRDHMTKLFHEPRDLDHAVVMMVDMDDLKTVNDTYGHEAGDCYLKGMAEVISQCTAPKQESARLGGDEFALMIYGCESEEELEKYIEEVRRCQKDYFVPFKGDCQLQVKFSIGCAFYPTEGEEYFQLKNLADSRMYDEKRKRKKK